MPAESVSPPEIPPARQRESLEPAQQPFTPLIRPIVFVNPVVHTERIENNTFREYTEGYQPTPLPEERDTGPIVIPPMPAPVVNVHILPPMQQERSPEVEFRTPRSWPEKVRDGDYRTSPTRQRYPEVEQPARTDPAETVPDDRPATKSRPDRDEPERSTVPESPVRQDTTPNKNSSPVGTKTVQPPNKNNSEKPTKTIPNNSPDPIVSELFEPDKSAPEVKGDDWKKVGKPAGRQRRYDELGIEEIESIQELFLVRHVTGKHWPTLSKDMEAYYEKFYFTRPKKGSKDYAKHVKCWERRTKWIAALTSDSAGS